jgi:hypothetical protein
MVRASLRLNIERRSMSPVPKLSFARASMVWGHRCRWNFPSHAAKARNI